MHSHSLQQALALAENLADDGPDWATVRELRIQLRAIAKDQENEAKAA